ncbi:MAG: hypothetical protein JRN73_09215 [Nitrososphaerota archaeon]|nr:hypothetical protein [Nitrososphaerota archaeon]MDG7020210.1 hypothetical protein [Nitrososphaerota archaeon]
MPARARKRPANVHVLRGVLEAVGALSSSGPSSFNALLGHLRSEGTVSNHRSLRTYLDLLVASKSVRVRSEPSRPNIRNMQVYAPTGRGPIVHVGEGAMLIHGLKWETGSDAVREEKLDLEGVARGTLDSGVLYGSVEDTVVDALANAKGAEARALAVTYCAALLVSKRLDEGYLLRRAKAGRVQGEVRELLDELRSILYAPRLSLRDVKTLYGVRRASPPLRRGGRARRPRWTLVSPDGLLDIVGKQLGVK